MTGRQPAVADQIAAALQRHQVEVIFGQSVPSAVLLAAGDRGIRQVTYRQENAGGAMADGYARASGRTGVVACRNGPAAALLVAPLAEALKASTAMVAIVQEVDTPASGRNAFQELDHESLFSGSAKWIRRMRTPQRVDDDVDAAFVAAASGRPGPAVLLVPHDLLGEPAVGGERERRQHLGHWPLDQFQPGPAVIDQAARMLAGARAPVVIAGGGATSAAASAALTALQEQASLPVFTTNMGKGAVDETHPLSAGTLGSLTGPGSLGRYTRELLAKADVVLLAGTRTNEDGTDSWRLIPPGAEVIHLDVDAQEIGRNYEALRLAGEAATTLAALGQVMAGLDLSARTAARGHAEARLAKAWQFFYSDRSEYAASKASPLRPERILRAIQDRLTADTIVAADASYSSNWVHGQLRTIAPGMRVLTPRGLAGLGWGVPLAIGAQLARPDHRVVAVAGDGGFAHAWAELETMARAAIPVVVVVLNNGVLAYQKDAETVKLGRYTTACHLGDVDHAAIARACGVAASRVQTPAELEEAFDEAFGSGQPWLLDVVTDPVAHPPVSLYDGTLDEQAASGPSQHPVS